MVSRRKTRYHPPAPDRGPRSGSCGVSSPMDRRSILRRGLWPGLRIDADASINFPRHPAGGADQDFFFRPRPPTNRWLVAVFCFERQHPPNTRTNLSFRRSFVPWWPVSLLYPFYARCTFGMSREESATSICFSPPIATPHATIGHVRIPLRIQPSI